MGTEELFHGLDQVDHAHYQDEIRERWDDTEAYRESMRRTRSYRVEDWAVMRQESDALLGEMVALVARGLRPDAPEALALAERHRFQIDPWFYPCHPEMHGRLADMYVGDARFAEFYERRAPGLAAWLAEAIGANATRGG